VAVRIKEALQAKGISVKFDDRDTYKPGYKFAESEMKGVPVRLAMGPRDLENGTVEVARRDTLEKETLQMTGIVDKIEHLLEKIQDNIFQKALSFREEMTTTADTWEDFVEIIKKGGFVWAHWDGTSETEQKIKEKTKATIRLIPINKEKKPGNVFFQENLLNKKLFLPARTSPKFLIYLF